jgi:parallel beta-helix repeat protein
VSGSSFPKIERNEIFGNTTSGITIRDNSITLIRNNVIKSNYYQISGRAVPTKLVNEMVEDNEITGDNEFTSNCAIF